MGFQIESGALGFVALLLLILIWITVFLTWAFSIWDIFFRRNLSGKAKAGWFILVIILLLIGTIIYLIARPKTESEEARWAPRVEGSSTVGQELERLAQLKADGHLSEEEFQRQKAKLLEQ